MKSFNVKILLADKRQFFLLIHAKSAGQAGRIGVAQIEDMLLRQGKWFDISGVEVTAMN
jgi:hypothetical protein